MKALKQFRVQINEVLKASDPIEKWIDDFVHSKNPKFAGKSTKERIEMAKGAYYAKQKNEAASISQNSTAVTDMSEDHLVHVSDGSKYDEVPHPKDIEHVKTGAMHHGGKWDSHSDKGAFFKFKSKEDAQHFMNHVKKCPHRTCDAHMSEAVEYKGIGTDVVDKKKVLNPPIPLTQTKKEVKDFKEAKELDKACWKGYKAIGLKNKNGRQVPNCVPEEKELEEGKVYDPITKKMVARKPIKVQAGGGATRNGVPVETGPSKYKTLRQAYDAATAGQTVTPKQKLNKEAYDHGPIDRDAKLGVGHKAAVLAGSGLDSGKHGTIVGSSKERTGDMWHIKTSSGDIVKMHKHRVAKLKEGVELIAKHEVKADAPHKSGGHVILTKSSNKWHVLHNKKSSPEAKDLHRSKLLHSYNDEKEARAKFKELHEEQIDEISKSTLMRYIPKASRDVGSYTYAGKEAGEHASQHTRAGDWEAAEKKTKKSYADFKKANKRIAGIDTATKKLGTQKEEVELDEAIAKKLPVQHAVDAVHATLGPKSATRFLSHLSPGSEKHTSWDKVNSALVKQGVQTHHIARIAQKTSHMNEEVNESRGHKTLATFFKNREVAQRAYQGNPAKDAEVAQGGGSPADQGIAAAKKDAEELKKKVSEARTPVVHAAEPKKTKSTPKEYGSATIPGTKRVAHAKPDNNEIGGGTATRITEDQYAADYKIKYYVDPITGENKQRKIRPHRVNFANSKMRGEPAQADASGDYGMKESYVVEGGFDNYHEIAKELIKRHGKNIDTSHINDLAGERDTHRGLDHSEVMHHVKKILGSKEVKEGDEYDERWKEYKGKTFKKESRMLKFNDYLKEAALSAKQKKIAAIAGDKDKIDADDLAALRSGKKPVEEAKDGWSDNDSLAKPVTSNQAMADHAKYFNKVTKLDPKTGEPIKKPVKEASCSDKDMKKEELVGNQHKLDKNKNGKLDAQDFKMLRKEETEHDTVGFDGNYYKGDKVAESAEQIDELSKKTLGSYVNKAAKDARMQGQIATDFENQGDKARKQSKKDSFERLHRKYLGHAWKREAGIAKAVNKLTKEEVQIDEGKMKELSMDLTDMGHDEFHKKYGNPKSHYDPKNFKKPVEPGKEMDRARALAQRGMKSVSEQLEEATSRKGFQMVADLIKGHESAEKRKELATHHAGIFAKQNPRFDHAKFMKAAGVNEEVSAEQSPYLKATLAVMDEGKIDDLRDAQKLRKDTQSAYDKNFKSDTSHPHITLNKGTAYGGANQKDDENDGKPEATEKKGRGRPAGSKSGARLKGGGHEDGGIPVHNLHLPKSYK